MLSDEVRRLLLCSILSAERLYLIFERTSYFSRDPSRRFLDELWIAVGSGGALDPKILKEVVKFIKSKKIPTEEDCDGVDLYGLNFVSAVQLLCDFFVDGNKDFLIFLNDDLEVSVVDHYLYDVTSPGVHILKDQGQEEAISNDPRMKRVEGQISDDKKMAMSVDLKSVVRDKFVGRIFDPIV